MNINFEFHEETLLINRNDLKRVLQEIVSEVQGEQGGNDIMTIKQTAELLQVSIPTVRAMIAKKEIPFYQRGQIIRLSKREIHQWFSSLSTGHCKEE